MLVANTKLLSHLNYTSLLELPSESFRASLLVPVCVDRPEVVVLETCAFPGCTEEVWKYRCSKCMLARYCGSVHSSGHWPQHKAACQPASQRPCVELVADGGWRVADCVESEGASTAFVASKVHFWPLVPVEGLSVVKLLVAFVDERTSVLICDQDSAAGLFDTAGIVGGKDAMEQLKQFMQAKGRPGTLGYRVAYCDANVSRAREGHIQLFLDKSLNCTW
jgi:hypothetical protein